MKELRSRLAADPTLEPHVILPKKPFFTFAMQLRGVIAVAAGGALGFLWITSPYGSRSPNLQADKEVALLSPRETPKPAAQNVAAGQAPDPLAAALYQDFLKWRQLQGR